MNYIKLINQFWRLNKEYAFSPSETQLYFKLLDTCNSLKWKNPFGHANRYVCGEINLSEPSLIRARNRLKEVGLIDFDSKKGRRIVTQYELKTLNDVSFSDSICNSINDENALDIIKHKQKQTKQKKSVQHFAPPTLDNVVLYYEKQKHLSNGDAMMLAQRFTEFYESKNWMVGRNRMTNWKAAASRALQWLKDDATPKQDKLNVATHVNSNSYSDF